MYVYNESNFFDRINYLCKKIPPNLFLAIVQFTRAIITMLYLSTEFRNEFPNSDNLDISTVINSSKTRQYLCFSCDCYFVLTVYTSGHWALFLSFILRPYKFFLLHFQVNQVAENLY